MGRLLWEVNILMKYIPSLQIQLKLTYFESLKTSKCVLWFYLRNHGAGHYWKIFLLQNDEWNVFPKASFFKKRCVSCSLLPQKAFWTRHKPIDSHPVILTPAGCRCTTPSSPLTGFWFQELIYLKYLYSAVLPVNRAQDVLAYLLSICWNKTKLPQYVKTAESDFFKKNILLGKEINGVCFFASTALIFPKVLHLCPPNPSFPDPPFYLFLHTRSSAPRIAISWPGGGFPSSPPHSSAPHHPHFFHLVCILREA